LLEVRLLGRLSVSCGGRTIAHWPSRKGKFLLAYLALNRDRRLARDLLMETFWPHSSPQAARNCLNVTLHGLRQVLRTLADRGDIIFYESESYFLSPDLALWVDVEEFKRAWAEGQKREREHATLAALAAYTRAARLYAGDLMEDDPYESWLDLEREHLREVFLVILDKMSCHYSLDGDPEGAIRLCEQMLEKDRCQEAVHRRLMLCYARLGLRDRALRQYLRCVEIMRKELDVAPTTETTRLYEAIKNPDRRPDLGEVDGSIAGRLAARRS
jgi:DNA-binding SARP family transcriptional activator